MVIWGIVYYCSTHMKIIIVPIVVFSWYLPFLDRAKNVANQLVHPGLSIYLMFNSRLLLVGG
jgi:hypothetical protein